MSVNAETDRGWVDGMLRTSQARLETAHVRERNAREDRLEAQRAVTYWRQRRTTLEEEPQP